MQDIASKIDAKLKHKGLSRYKLCKLINCSDGAFNQMARGNRSFSEKIIENILPILEVSKDEFTAWIIADKYSIKMFRVAINELKNKSANKVLAINIDKILLAKNLSRTALSKLINYSQSGLNRMITGQISMSKSVISRLSPVLEVSEDTIQAWILADKYSLTVLELALNNDEVN